MRGDLKDQQWVYPVKSHNQTNRFPFLVSPRGGTYLQGPWAPFNGEPAEIRLVCGMPPLPKQDYKSGLPGAAMRCVPDTAEQSVLHPVF